MCSRFILRVYFGRSFIAVGGENMNHESEVWFVKDCCGVGMSVVVCDLCDIHQLGLFTLDDDICLL